MKMLTALHKSGVGSTLYKKSTTLYTCSLTRSNLLVFSPNIIQFGNVASLFAVRAETTDIHRISLTFSPILRNLLAKSIIFIIRTETTWIASELYQRSIIFIRVETNLDSFYSIFLKMLTDARFKFALESLKKCMEMEPKSNVFFSPHLIYQNLLVVYFGTENDTDFDNALRRVLNIPCYITKAVVQQFYYFGGYTQFCYVMNGPNDTYTCRILSRVLISENSQIFNSTLNLFSSGHQVKEIIFEMRPDLDLKFINNSINCVTQQNIQNVLAPTSINTDTEVVIYNAIYCKGRFSESWFDLNISDDSDQENEKNGSTLKGKKATESRLDVYVMEIPFKQNKISTFFFFPSDSSRYKKNDCTENEKIMQIIEQMTTEEGSQKLRNVLDCGVAERSYMTFPIFKIEQSLRMYELLDKLGLSELTAYGSAILHEFSNKTLKLGDALHRINIEVTMEGVTAAACDLFFSDNDCQHAKINDSTSDNLFPCICLIYDKCNRNILFCGALFDS